MKNFHGHGLSHGTSMLNSVFVYLCNTHHLTFNFVQDSVERLGPGCDWS